MLQEYIKMDLHLYFNNNSLYYEITIFYYIRNNFYPNDYEQVKFMKLFFCLIILFFISHLY